MAKNNLRSKHLRNKASVWDMADLMLQNTYYNGRSHSILEAQFSLSQKTPPHTNRFWSPTCLVLHRNSVTEAAMVSSSPEKHSIA